VGMGGREELSRFRTSCWPHACGDGWYLPMNRKGAGMLAPRMWGWVVLVHHHDHRVHVGPTHVGMDGRSVLDDPIRPRWQHTCGGGWRHQRSNAKSIELAPRMWGWVGHQAGSSLGGEVGLTHVGMDGQARGEAVRSHG